MARVPIRFDSWYRVLSTVVGVLPSSSFVDLDGDQVSVRMGYAFRTSFPRSAVANARPLDDHPLSRGVHGLAGRWLVNGAGDRLLSIDLAPTQAARVLGFPVRLRQLVISVDDPAALAAQLSAGA